MPTAETLEQFIALVERNAHAEAIEAFYAPNASMQENQSAPRLGRDNLVANERRVLAKAKAVSSTCIRRSRVAIHVADRSQRQRASEEARIVRRNPA
jgi:hypothetical protein